MEAGGVVAFRKRLSWRLRAVRRSTANKKPHPVVEIYPDEDQERIVSFGLESQGEEVIRENFEHGIVRAANCHRNSHLRIHCGQTQKPLSIISGMLMRRKRRPRQRRSPRCSPQNSPSCSPKGCGSGKFLLSGDPPGAADASTSLIVVQELRSPQLDGDFGGTFSKRIAGCAVSSRSGSPITLTPRSSAGSDIGATGMSSMLDPRTEQQTLHWAWPASADIEDSGQPCLGIGAESPVRIRSASPSSTVSTCSRGHHSPGPFADAITGFAGADPFADRALLPGTPLLPHREPHFTPELFVLYASPQCPQLPRAIEVRSELELLSSVLEETQARWRVHVGVATAETLLQLMTRCRAGGRFLVHVVAHCDNHPKEGVGLVLEDACGGPHVLYRDRLSEMLRANGGLDQLPLLFLNTCWSEVIAELFADCGCSHVVATHGAVLDEAARKFAQQFYFSLSSDESIRQAWESAKQALKIDPRVEVQQNADRFTLVGTAGQGLDSVSRKADNLDLLCRPAGSSRQWRPTRGWEDIENALEVPSLPPRAEDFVGRGSTLRDVLRVLGGGCSGPGGDAKRACVLFGPGGIGKTAVVMELAHFAASAGRLFSRAVVCVKLESRDLEVTLTALAEAVEGLAEALGPGGSGCSRSPSGGSDRSPSTHAPSPFNGTPKHKYSEAPSPKRAVDLAGERLRRAGYLLEEACRLKRRALLVLDDQAGILHQSVGTRDGVGHLLQTTRRLRVLCTSRRPVYQPLGQHRCENLNLGPLTNLEAARLFLRRRNRPLFAADFSDPADEFPSSFDELLRRVAAHPLLVSLAGHPARVRAAAARVTPGLKSLFDLCGPLPTG